MEKAGFRANREAVIDHFFNGEHAEDDLRYLEQLLVIAGAPLPSRNLILISWGYTLGIPDEKMKMLIKSLENRGKI